MLSVIGWAMLCAPLAYWMITCSLEMGVSWMLKALAGVICFLAWAGVAAYLVMR